MVNGFLTFTFQRVKKYITNVIGLNENEVAVSTLENVFIVDIDVNKNKIIHDISFTLDGKIRTLIPDKKVVCG